MPQMRFNIGVPRAGSAARQAEGESGDFRSLRPKAGSAARQAEEQRRLEGPMCRATAATIRVTSGARTQAAPPDSQSAEAPQAKPAVVAAISQGRSTLQGGPAPLRDTSPSTDGYVPPTAESPALNPHGPLQAAADKIKSLVQSLFRSGGIGQP